MQGQGTRERGRGAGRGAGWALCSLSNYVHGDGRSRAPSIAVGSVGCLPPADASVDGVLQRPLSTCASLLQGAWAARLHPAQGTGRLRLQVPTRQSTRIYRSAPVSASILFVAAVEAASDLVRRASGRAVWPACAILPSYHRGKSKKKSLFDDFAIGSVNRKWLPVREGELAVPLCSPPHATGWRGPNLASGSHFLPASEKRGLARLPGLLPLRSLQRCA